MVGGGSNGWGFLAGRGFIKLRRPFAQTQAYKPAGTGEKLLVWLGGLLIAGFLLFGVVGFLAGW